MRRFPTHVLTVGVLAAAAFTFRAAAQDGPPGPRPQEGGQRDGAPRERAGAPRELAPRDSAAPREGGPRDGRPAGGFHLIPRFAAEQLDLTEEQQKQIGELEKEIKARLEKILTPEQMKILAEARPPRPPQGGSGGREGGGQPQGDRRGGPGGELGGDRPEGRQRRGPGGPPDGGGPQL